MRSFNYSLKNIPLPSRRSDKLQLIDKIESVVKRMRWKAIQIETSSRPTDRIR